MKYSNFVILVLSYVTNNPFKTVQMNSCLYKSNQTHIFCKVKDTKQDLSFLINKKIVIYQLITTLMNYSNDM